MNYFFTVNNLPFFTIIYYFLKELLKPRFTKKELFRIFTVFVGILGYVAGKLAFEKYKKNLISSKKN